MKKTIMLFLSLLLCLALFGCGEQNNGYTHKERTTFSYDGYSISIDDTIEDVRKEFPSGYYTEEKGEVNIKFIANNERSLFESIVFYNGEIVSIEIKTRGVKGPYGISTGDQRKKVNETFPPQSGDDSDFIARTVVFDINGNYIIEKDKETEEQAFWIQYGANIFNDEIGSMSVTNFRVFLKRANDYLDSQEE